MAVIPGRLIARGTADEGDRPRPVPARDRDRVQPERAAWWFSPRAATAGWSIVKQAQAVSGVTKVHAVIGGFHLAPYKEDYVRPVVAASKRSTSITSYRCTARASRSTKSPGPKCRPSSCARSPGHGSSSAEIAELAALAQGAAAGEATRASRRLNQRRKFRQRHTCADLSSRPAPPSSDALSAGVIAAKAAIPRETPFPRAQRVMSPWLTSTLEALIV